MVWPRETQVLVLIGVVAQLVLVLEKYFCSTVIVKVSSILQNICINYFAAMQYHGRKP